MNSRINKAYCMSIAAGVLGYIAILNVARAESSIRLPQSFYGFYVYASDKNDGASCKKSQKTPTQQLERDPEDPNDHVGFQMSVTASEIRYDGIGTHVLCKIQKVYRPENKRSGVAGPKFLGSWLRPDDPLYVLDLTCFDEGSTSRFSEMWRLVRLRSSTIALTTNKSMVTDAWAKCEAE